MKGEQSWIPTETDLDWIEAASIPLHPVLRAIEEAARPARIPIVDRSAGRVLAVLAASRRRIVELGTAYGYSTLWMALAQPTDGTIVTVDPDADRTRLARGWWREAGVDERVTVVTDRALDALSAGHRALAGPFDLAFLDAVKPEYDGYLEALIPRLAPNALVVADNVLWSGRVAGSRPAASDDRSAVALAEFDRRVLRDPRFVATILPVGDGLLVAALRS